MIKLEEQMVPNIKEIVYFKNGGNIYAILNTYTNLYSHMKDLKPDDQDFFNDLANDTKDDENVHIYDVSDELVSQVEEFLSSNFTKTDRYEYLEELDASNI